MTSTFLLLISGMHIYKPHHHKRITSSVDQSLVSRILDRRRSSTVPYMVGRQQVGRDFRNHLPLCMEFLNFKSCLADPDVWMRPAIKSDGNTYYEYILLYVDDTLVVSKNAESILRNELGRYFHIKEESIGPPTIYSLWSVILATLFSATGGNFSAIHVDYVDFVPELGWRFRSCNLWMSIKNKLPKLNN